jgi:hypothetical protein
VLLSIRKKKFREEIFREEFFKDDVQMQNEIINQAEFKYVLRESNDKVELGVDDDDSEMNKDFL